MGRAEVKAQKLDATVAQLEGKAMPEGAAWATTAREAARTRLFAMGLPAPRDEYWRWTRPHALTSETPTAATPYVSEETAVFSEIDALDVVFVDGVFDADASDALEGLEICRLQEAMTADIHWAKEAYGALETKAHTPVERPMAAYNSAYATDGIVLRVSEKIERPVRITYVHQDDTSDVILHHLVSVAEGAEVTILETGCGGARSNTVMEVTVEQGGAFHHVRAQGRDHDRAALTHVFAAIGSESQFKSFTLTANGVLTRNEAYLEINGDDAQAHIAGAALGDGAFHHDDTVFVTHDAERCESRQVFKKVLRNGANGVFQGKILVKDGAQKTDGYQISQGLLLDEDSQFLAKPELEIYADDVACSHGSTVGAIDETALFYLRSRGVPAAQATDLLTLAFLAEAIDEIAREDIADAVQTRLETWLSDRIG